MTHVITSQCIECHRCESLCPTGAITRNEHHYQSNSERCNDCLGHDAVPQCWAVCPPKGGYLPDLVLDRSPAASLNDYWEAWCYTDYHRVSRLSAKPPSDYWQRWFDTYAQALSKQLQPRHLWESTHEPSHLSR